MKPSPSTARPRAGHLRSRWEPRQTRSPQQCRLKLSGLSRTGTGAFRQLLMRARGVPAAVTNRLFRELCSIALNDARLARALDQFYARSVSAHLRRLTDRSAVTAQSERLEAIVFLLHAISEGTTVLFGMQLRSSELFERVRGVAHEAIMKLLLEPARAK